MSGRMKEWKKKGVDGFKNGGVEEKRSGEMEKWREEVGGGRSQRRKWEDGEVKGGSGKMEEWRME